MGNGGFLFGRKHLTHEIDSTPPLACDDKNTRGAIPCSHKYIFVALFFIQHKDSPTLQYNNSNIMNHFVPEFNACSDQKKTRFKEGLHKSRYSYVTLGILSIALFVTNVGH